MPLPFAEARANRIAKGKCGKCSQPAQPGKRLCARHAEYERQRLKAYRLRQKER